MVIPFTEAVPEAEQLLYESAIQKCEFPQAEVTNLYTKQHGNQSEASVQLGFPSALCVVVSQLNHLHL